MRGVVMWMGDDDCGDTAQGVDLGDGVVVEIGNAVPEDVAAGSEEEEGALADAVFGGGVEGVDLGVGVGIVQWGEDVLQWWFVGGGAEGAEGCVVLSVFILY